MKLFISDSKSAPVEMFAGMIEHIIQVTTGDNVKIKLPLETEKEKELFIKAIESVERQSV